MSSQKAAVADSFHVRVCPEIIAFLPTRSPVSFKWAHTKGPRIGTNLAPNKHPKRNSKWDPKGPKGFYLGLLFGVNLKAPLEPIFGSIWGSHLESILGPIWVPCLGPSGAHLGHLEFTTLLYIIFHTSCPCFIFDSLAIDHIPSGSESDAVPGGSLF